ncbi:MAG: hypothetical protein NVV74_00925 [Magnetospirillum sp.]|nr:hypothetical protein [Magnetospirillum sp.]
MNKILLLVLLIAATLGGFYALSRPAPEKALRTNGVYADDWQTNCGPLQGAAQSKCTARLDAAYGRSANAPVPAGR